MESVNITLHMAEDFANWARHYDTIRIGISSFLLVLATAIVPAAIFLGPRRPVCAVLLIVSLAGGIVLVGLTAVYGKLYFETSHASFKMRHLATRYANNKSLRLDNTKLEEKVAQAYFEVFCKDKICECDDEVPDDTEVAREWRYRTWVRILSSSWFWLNSALGIFLPGVLIVLLYKRRLPA